ncbi:MAG: alpha-amylase family glycosyl hydrolase [Bacteroidota bacterium]
MKTTFYRINAACMTVWLVILMVIMSGILSCKPKPLQTEDKVNNLVQVKHPAWSKNLCIYEVNLRQYSKTGSIAEFEKQLPRLKEMGTDILWFMPIHPIGSLKRKGSLGSYYSVKDYKAIDPSYGTLADFKAMVKKCHEMGMYVIIDWVANHTSWDNQLIYDHPDWYSKDSLGNSISPFDWTDVADLNYNNKDLRAYMINAMKYWLKETDIDGFRCDVAGMVPLDFWIDTRNQLDQIKPVFMLAEAEEAPLHQAFDMTYGWELYHLMNQIAKGKKNANDLLPYFAKNDSTYPSDAYRMYFTSNHDENSWNDTEYERLGDGVKTFAVLSATVPGMLLVYTGQEASLKKKLQFFEKDPVDWSDLSMIDFYKPLLALKKNNAALWNGVAGGSFNRIETNADNSIFAYLRIKDNAKIFVILNLSKTQQSITLKGDAYTGKYRNIYTNEQVNYSKDMQLSLKPWEYIVLEK